MTHQARDYKQKYTDWCAFCKETQDEKSARASKSAHAGDRFVRHHAAKWLRENGIEPQPYGKFAEVIVRHKTYWRAAKHENRFIQLGQGWLLQQEYDFHFSDEGHAYSNEGTRPFMTLLADQGYPTPVKWERGKLVFGGIGSVSFKGSYDRIAEEVSALVGKPAPLWKI